MPGDTERGQPGTAGPGRRAANRAAAGAGRRAACLAVARERQRAAETLQTAVGQPLAGIAATAAAARRALPHDAAAARAQIAAAGVAAREAVAQARALTAGWRSAPEPETAAAPAGRSRLAGLARELGPPRRELARMTVLQERLRLARDVHDLLGLGLSAVALKADLIAALIERDDVRAAAEMEELGQVCAAARAEIRGVTGQSPRLSLSAELATARQVLTSADIEVSASMPAAPLLAAADGVLAPVLREAVTNILRHAAATACTMEVTVGDSAVRLHVRNDGVIDQPGAQPPPAGTGGGHGLANLTARVQAAGGQLTIQQEGGRFELLAQLPAGTGPGRAGL